MKNMTNLFLSFFLLFFACKPATKNNNENTNYNQEETGLFAKITTSKGDILLALEFEKTPVTVANFVALAEGEHPFVEDKYKNIRFYDGLKFHRVIANFMIQGGDPLGTGSGDPGYKFNDEFHPDLKHDKAGILSMANSGPKTNGSQFFITHKETPWLDNKHTVFGHVVEGQEIVNKIAKDDVIEKITIIRKGKAAKKFNAAKVFKQYKKEEDKQNKEIAEKQRKIAAKKIASIEQLKSNGTKMPSGLIYEVIKKGEGEKPVKGEEVHIHYAGFLTNGTLFDTSYETVATEYGKLDARKAAAKAYKPFPFKYGEKQGLIKGFIEAIEQMNYNDKIRAYIPANLAYGKAGAGNVIPPNSDIVFEIELLKK